MLNFLSSAFPKLSCSSPNFESDYFDHSVNFGLTQIERPDEKVRMSQMVKCAGLNFFVFNDGESALFLSLSL